MLPTFCFRNVKIAILYCKFEQYYSINMITLLHLKNKMITFFHGLIYDVIGIKSIN